MILVIIIQDSQQVIYNHDGGEIFVKFVKKVKQKAGLINR